jgi:deoxyribonuclease IV
MLRIGGHVIFSRANIALTFQRAKAIGANTVQIFGASPAQWRAPLLEPEQAKKFRVLAKEHHISPIFLHAPYLINLASPKAQLAAMSRSLLAKHLAIANTLGADGVIFHIGTRGSQDERVAERKVADALSRIFDEVKEGRLLIENNAGAGHLVGATLREIGRIIKQVKSPRLGVCYDTAHGFESGVLTDFSAEEVKKFVAQFDEHIGIKKLWAIHANDSKTPAHSNRDRHENIGQGYIGAEAFKTLLHDPKLRSVPFILEVPGFDGGGPDKKNIDILRTLAQ